MIILSAVLGGIVTLFVSQRLQRRKKRLQADILGKQGIGGVPAAVGIKVTFQGQEYDFLNIHFVQIKNIGTEEIEDVELIFCVDNGKNNDWFQKIIQPDGAHHANFDIVFENGYLVIRLDYLNSGEDAQFALVSDCKNEIEIRSRTKGAEFTDLRAKRERALGLGMKMLRFTRAFVS